MQHDPLTAQGHNLSRSFSAVLHRWFFFCAVVSALIGGTVAMAQGSEDLIGATRGDVIRALGMPENTLQKGDVDVLMYPNGVRIEIRDDIVVGHRGSIGSGVLSRGGTQYAAGEDGNVRKADPPEPDLADESAAEEVDTEAETATEVTEPVVKSTEDLAGDEEKPSDVEEEIDPEGIYDDVQAQAEEYLEGYGIVEESEPPPAWATAVGAIVGLVARFAFVLLILRLTLGWMGRPFFFPDLVKISLLYTAIYTGVHGLGTLGGNWQFIQFFKVADITSFFALAILVFKFGVTKDGLTALKIAVATKLVTYFLMIAIGIVLVFGIGALH